MIICLNTELQITLKSQSYSEKRLLSYVHCFLTISAGCIIFLLNVYSIFLEKVFTDVPSKCWPYNDVTEKNNVALICMDIFLGHLELSPARRLWTCLYTWVHAPASCRVTGTDESNGRENDSRHWSAPSGPNKHSTKLYTNQLPWYQWDRSPIVLGHLFEKLLGD